MRPLLALALLLAGCTFHRQVTPWLRTRVEHPFVLFAESGGPHDRVFTERLADGQWAAVSTCCSGAMALPGGRAVFHQGGTLVTASERSAGVPVDCGDEWLRLDPGGARLVCVSPTEHWADPARPLAVRVTWWSLDGQLQESREAPLGDRLLPANYFPHFAGFLGGQPLLTAHVPPIPTTSGLAGFCAAWVLDGVEWKPVARLPTRDWPRCGEADFWRDRVPGSLEPGEAPAPL